VFLPRARKKERELLSKTQNFKDVNSIKAIVLIHRKSGLPIFYKTFGFLEETDPSLFAAFVQAITTIGLEIAEKEKGVEFSKKQRNFSEHMMEIDFKYFYALVYDHKNLRVVVILNERSSEALRQKIKDLSISLIEVLEDELEEFKGDLSSLEELVSPIIYSSIDFYYKDTFQLSYDYKTQKSRDLTSLELRVLNVLASYIKNKKDFLLVSILEMVSEKNKDLVIEAIERLIQKRLIIPISKNYDFKNLKEIR
jgi:hypothetical protein